MIEYFSPTMDNLSGFDPSTMTYLTTQMVQPNANFGDNMDPFSELLLQQADASGPHTPYNYALYVTHAIGFDT